MGVPWMTAERFYANTTPHGDCLLWNGKARIGSYGKAGHQGVGWLAHRLSYFFATGELPLVVRHTCDTPLCVNPSHLLSGTHADNVQDKVDRGRQFKGESHPLVKLSQEDVTHIREIYAQGRVLQKELAKQYGVSKSQISRITRGERWQN